MKMIWDNNGVVEGGEAGGSQRSGSAVLADCGFLEFIGLC